MEFLMPGQKIRKIRKMLGLRQYHLQGERVKRNFISMIETGERGLTRETAKIIVQKLKEKADSLGVDVEISVDYLMMFPQDEARRYCTGALEGSPSLEKLEEVIEIAEKYSLGDIKAGAYVLKADLIYGEKDYKRAFVAYVETLDAFRNIDSNEKNAYVFNRLGLCALNRLDFSEALEFFKKAHDYSIINNDRVTLKNSLYNIALSYRKLFMHDEAIEYINKYLSLCTENDEPGYYVYAKIILANCYRDKKDLGEAIDIYNDLMKDDTSLSAHLKGFIYNNLGILCYEIDSFKESLMYFNMSEEIRIGEGEYLSHTLIDKAKLYLKQNAIDEAEALIRRGLDIAKENNDLEYILKGYYLLEKIYPDESKKEELYLKIIDVLKEDIKTNFNEIHLLYTKLSLMNLNNNNIEKGKNFLKMSLNLVEKSDINKKICYDDFKI